MSNVNIKKAFEDLKKERRNGAYSIGMAHALENIYNISINELSKAFKVQLISCVPGKSYFSFSLDNKISRPINSSLYDPSLVDWQSLITILNTDQLHSFSLGDLEKILYTSAISFCAAVDLLSTGDQKTPGTFFEYYIAFFFSWRLNINPQSSIQIQSLDNEQSSLPTDHIFNLGRGKRKFHMPVKTSSRERAIMLWAHQKLIDGVYGNGRFMGTPVLMQETKLDRKNKQVVEICLPGQWQLYQLYIAKLTRIYYLDPPQAYLKLSQNFPPLYVKSFAEFFFEWDTITPL